MTEQPTALQLDWDSLFAGPLGWEVEGDRLGGAGASVLIITAQPGQGPALHRHPYPEILVILEGRVTLTVGGETLEAHARQIILVPAHVPHAFVNTGSGILRQVDIHCSSRFETDWLNAA